MRVRGTRTLTRAVTAVATAATLGLMGVVAATANDESPETPDGLHVEDLQANEVTLSWEASAGADDYIVELYIDGYWYPGQVDATEDTSHTFFLEQGVYYEASVVARGPGGRSPDSEHVQFTTPTDPDNPPVVTPADVEAEAIVTDAGVDAAVSWSPSHSDAGGLYYILKIEWDTWTDTERTSTPQLTFDANPNTTYKLTVIAIDAVGRSARSEPIALTTPELPISTITDVDVNTSPGNMTVTWNKPEAALPITKYELKLSGTVARTFTTEDTSVEFDYAPGGDFAVTVRARDVERQWSDPSEPVDVTLTPHPDWAPPTAPQNFQVDFDENGRTERYSWDASSGGVGPLTYELHITGYGQFDRTTDLFLDSPADFRQCVPGNDEVGEFFVIANSYGVKSPPSNKITLCF